MEKFKISDIQEIFVSDVERFHSLTQHHVSQLLNEATPSQDALDEALRQCHTLKGLAATVEAWGLAGLGADLEKLLELAGSWMQGERAKANEVFEFILDHMQDWYVMNQFTCMDMLPQAWDVYRGLRAIMEERWQGYLPSPESTNGADAQYVRLAELEISELEVGSAEDSNATPEVQDSTTANAELKEDLDVQGVLPEAASPVAPTGAPLPVRVVPPTLRHRNQATVSASTENFKVSPETPMLPAAEPAVTAEQPAAPKPLQVVPPVLRRRADAVSGQDSKVQGSTAEVESESVLPTSESIAPVIPEAGSSMAHAELPSSAMAAPTNEVPPVSPTAKVDAATSPVTPPLLRVAPPALKRRGKKLVTEPTTAVHEGAVAPVLPVAPSAQVSAQPLEVESSAVTPSPVESGAEALSAEAIFAALPESAEADVMAVSAASVESAGGFKPGADADLLEMLSQEVSGYLAELTASLLALAGDLAAQEPWEKTRRLFHTIKGTAATFGLDAVSAPAKAAEVGCLAAAAEVGARTPAAFEACVHRAAVVAKGLNLPFDEGQLREALRVAEASAENVVAASAPMSVAALDPEMAGFFINDTRDQVGIIEQAVLRWERLPAGQSGAAVEQLQAVQRGFHTIKGAGNSIGLTAVALSVHEVEAFLEELSGKLAEGSELQVPSSELAGAKGGARNLKPVFTFLLGAVDQLRQYLVALARNTASPWRQDWSAALRWLSEPTAGVEAEKRGIGESAAEPAVVAASLAVESDADEDAATLRVETARLYELMNLISEMVIDRARLARKIELLAGLHRALTERNGALTGAVLTFQQQFEFNLVRRGEKEKLEGRSEKIESGTPNSQLLTPSSASHGEFSELEFDRYDQFNVLARSLVEISHDIEQLNGEVAACLDSFAAENVQFTQTSQELQGKVTGLGLVPVKSLFPRLQRAFRDALAVEGKAAELVLAGGEVLLDKGVVDRVYVPLLHLLRNAVAHGIEDAATRELRKKSARGTVRLSAAQVCNQVVLQLVDDGAGVDAPAVRARAVAKGWLPADAPELTVDQVVAFIFRPGFSTATRVTSVSGRGIGLDVVRQVIEHLNGSVELKFEPGVGASWSLRLPVSLSISEAVLAEVGGAQFAFPLNFIEAGLILEEPSQWSAAGAELYPVVRREVVLAQAAEGRGQMSEDGSQKSEGGGQGSDLGPLSSDVRAVAAGAEFDLLPVLRLARLFGVAGRADSNKGLIVAVGERRAIVVVDVVLRRQEVVVKPLDVVMAGHLLLNGASVDAEGRVIPILNLPSLLKWGESSTFQVSSSKLGERGTRNSELGTKTRVLVVDDSLSVRKVQERFLRDLGCSVAVASDGLAALERLRESDFDLVFTDLEMPRMNGFELISDLRGNPAWSHLPVVVVSSRGGDKYITKALGLGASTFLTKPFSQEQLAQVLGHYVKG